jgi:hypothetical protein
MGSIGMKHAPLDSPAGSRNFPLRPGDQHENAGIVQRARHFAQMGFGICAHHVDMESRVEQNAFELVCVSRHVFSQTRVARWPDGASSLAGVTRSPTPTRARKETAPR